MIVDGASGSSGTRSPVQPTNSAPATNPNDVAPRLVEQATPRGSTRPDVSALATATTNAAATHPQTAPKLRKEVETYLTPVELGQFTRVMQDMDAPKVPKDSWEQAAKDRHDAAVKQRRDIDGDGTVSLGEVIATVNADKARAVGTDVPIRHLHLNDNDYKGIPQGQGYDAASNEFLTTYYAKGSGGGTDVRLSIQDKATGYETSYVKLKGPNGEELSHGGGVSSAGKWVFVSDGGKVYAYDRAAIERAGPEASISASNSTDTKVGSFMNVSPDGKYAYVGEFDKYLFGGLFGSDEGSPELYRYEIDQKTGELINKSGPEKIPNNAQGVAITDEGLIFTTSFGSKRGVSPNEVIFQKFAKDPSDGFALQNRDDAKTLAEIPYYAEGANVIGDSLYVTHESGAEEYKGADGIQEIQKYRLDEMDW